MLIYASACLEQSQKLEKNLLILFIVSTFVFFESPLKFEKFDLRNYA
jgi:hypothetical protein